jgi:xanthine dehydrogenase accessory factor
VTTTDRIEQLAAHHKDANRPFAMATVVRTEDMTSAKAGAKALIDGKGDIEGWVGGGCGRARLIRIRPGEVESNAAGIEEYQAHCHSGGTLDIFIEPVLPRPSLMVLGASPVGQILARLSHEVGYTVAAACRAEDAPLYACADRIIEGFELGDAIGPGSVIVVATQGRGDKNALQAALATDAGYVAFVASRRKAAKIKQELLESGCDAARVNAIRAPAGLDITAVTPEEVAVSILGEMIQFRRAAPPQATTMVLEDDGSKPWCSRTTEARCSWRSSPRQAAVIPTPSNQSQSRAGKNRVSGRRYERARCR